MNFNQSEFDILKDNFAKIYKRIENYIRGRKLTENLDKRNEYKIDIVTSFNSIVGYLSDCATKDLIHCDRFVELLIPFKTKVQATFEILSLEYNFPQTIFTKIDINLITQKQVLHEQIIHTPTVPQLDGEGTSSSISQNIDDLTTDSASETLTEINSRLSTESNHSIQSDPDRESDENELSDTNSEIIINNKMPQSASEFLKLAASIINYKFNGDPLKLESFLTDIELVEELAEDSNKELCLKFVKSKLEAKALECLPENVNEIKNITDALKTQIKPDTPRVIEGRMLALRLEKGNFTKFSEQVEKLAEAFRRSLIAEGMSKKMAQEMTIAKTVDVCRKTTRSEIVKSVLASTTFDKPESVVAKFVTESDMARKEYKEAEAAKAVKAKSHSSQKFDKNSKNRHGHNHKDNNKKYNNYQGNSGQYNRNGQNQNNNRQNQNGRYNNNNSGRQHNNREHTVRIISGNGQDPPNGGPSQEHFVRMPMD